MDISDVIRPENISLNLSAPSKARLLQLLSEMAGKALGISDREIFAALQNREKLGSTGIGAGIAIPHAPVAGVVVPFSFLARLARPIAFESIDDIPVDVVCLLLTPPDKQTSYLSVLACIARQLRSPDIMKKIRASSSQEQLYAAIIEGVR